MKKLIVLALAVCSMQNAYTQSPAKGYKLTVVAEGNFGTPNGDIFHVIKGSAAAEVHGPLYQEANGTAGIDVLQDFDFYGDVAVLCGKGVNPLKLAVVNYPGMDTLFTVSSGLGAGIQRCAMYDESKAFIFAPSGSTIKMVDIAEQTITDVADPDTHLSSGVHSMARFNNHMFTANSSKLMKIDPETNTAVGSLLPGITGINTMVRDDANHCLWILGKQDGVSAIVKMTEDEEFEEPIVLTGITNARLLRVGPGKLYFVSGSGFFVYDIGSGETPEAPVYTATISSPMYDRSFTVDPNSGDFAYTSAGAYIAPGLYEVIDGETFTRIDSGAVTGAAIPNELFLTTWPLGTWDTTALQLLVAECQVELTAPVAYYEGHEVTGTTGSMTITELGVHEVIWTYVYEDQSITQVQVITVEDTVQPVPQVEELPALTGNCPYTLTAPRADDNCADEIAGTTDVMIFDEAGDYTIVWTYSDEAGNTITQEQSLTVTCDPSSLEDLHQLTARVYPNPADQYIQVDLEEAGLYTFIMIDLSGKEMMRKQFNAASAEVGLQVIPEGVYYISISNQDGQTYMQKLVIVK